MQLRVVTPGSASPGGAGQHDHSTPLVEGPPSTPGDGPGPAFETPPSCTLWEMMNADSPFTPRVLGAAAATAEPPGTAAASSSFGSPLDMDTADAFIATAIAADATVELPGTAVDTADAAEDSVAFGSPIATAAAATTTGATAVAVAAAQAGDTAGPLSATATAPGACMPPLAPAGPQEAAAPPSTVAAQPVCAKGMSSASCSVSQP